MLKNKTFHRKKIVTIFGACLLICLLLAGRLVYLMLFQADYYIELATELHEKICVSARYADAILRNDE